MSTSHSDHQETQSRWPNGARAAISLTFDNMGEAQDLNRGLWPDTKPVGQHASVTTILPQLLALLAHYDVSITYFVESWNLGVYGAFIRTHLLAAGHELGWHAWQHEAWSDLLDDEGAEKANFARSFGPQGIGQWATTDPPISYRGFRPPGGSGLITPRTLGLCRAYGLGYISPAGEEAALVDVDGRGEGGEADGAMVVLPFRWTAMDAHYYCVKYAEDPRAARILVERFTGHVDEAIERGGFLSLLFHPFLVDSPERLEAFEDVLKHLVRRRDEGKIWLARCQDVETFIRDHPDSVGRDPKWNLPF